MSVGLCRLRRQAFRTGESPAWQSPKPRNQKQSPSSPELQRSNCPQWAIFRVVAAVGRLHAGGALHSDTVPPSSRRLSVAGAMRSRFDSIDKRLQASTRTFRMAERRFLLRRETGRAKGNSRSTSARDISKVRCFRPAPPYSISRSVSRFVKPRALIILRRIFSRRKQRQ